VTRTTLTGIGALDASVRTIVSRPMTWHGVLAAEPLEVGSKPSARFSRIRSQGACRGYQPGRVVHFWCRKLVHFQMTLDIKRRKLLDRSWAGLFRKEILPHLLVEAITAAFHARLGRPSKDAYTLMGALVFHQASTLIRMDPLPLTRSDPPFAYRFRSGSGF